MCLKSIVIIFFSAVFLLPGCETDQGEQVPDVSLTNTYWKLVELKGQAVVTVEGQREVKFTLRKENKFTGYAGCNSFFGNYQYNETKLSFSQLAASRKFCMGAMDKESIFLDVLKKNSEYSLSGDKLQLMNEKGDVIARLEAVYLQ